MPVSKNLSPSNYHMMSPSDIDTFCRLLANYHNMRENYNATRQPTDFDTFYNARDDLLIFISDHTVEILDLVQRGRHTRNAPQYNRDYSHDDLS